MCTWAFAWGLAATHLGPIIGGIAGEVRAHLLGLTVGVHHQPANSWPSK